MNTVIASCCLCWSLWHGSPAAFALQALPELSTEAVSSRPAAASAAITLGPRDELSIWALGVNEIGDKPLRIDQDGYIDVPLIGRIRAAGLTLDAFRAELLTGLAEYVREPRATVSVIQHGAPVSVVGSVTRPGVYQIHPGNTVLDVVSLAGGLAADAGRVVRLTRPADSACKALPGSTDVGGSIVLDLRKLLEGSSDANEFVCARDVVTVPRADLIYVVGEVQKAGAFAINERGGYTVLQALSLAGGITRTAKPSGARILREQGGSTRLEIPVNLSKLTTSKNEDLQLLPGDVLYVPDSLARSASRRAAEAAVQLAIGVAIFR